MFKKKKDKKEKRFLFPFQKEENDSEKVDLEDLPKDGEEEPIEERMKVSEELPIIWQAPEFEFREKDVSWYWISLIVSILFVTFALWQKNFLFAVFVIMAELFILYFGNLEPKIWNFAIDEKSIKIGENKEYLFKNLISFDIHPFDDDYNELILKTREKLTPLQKIFIHIEDSEIIEAEISKSVKREELPISFVEILERLIRF